KVIHFLTRHGLVEEKDGAFTRGSSQVFLGTDSLMVNTHLTNWKNRTIHSLESVEKNDLHYASVVTVSESDIPKIKETLLKAIESVRKIVKDSPEEDLFCYTLDLFRV